MTSIMEIAVAQIAQLLFVIRPAKRRLPLVQAQPLTMRVIIAVLIRQ